MSQQNNIATALLRVVSAINQVSGRLGQLSSLDTTEKGNLVAALNEVKSLIPDVATVIDDAATATNKTWSSTRIQTQINAALASILGGVDGSSDTLKELADQITALAQADNGLLSFTQNQSLSPANQLQACTNLGLGDPAHNYVPGIEAALSNGL
jgi:hypothetical protein